MSSGLVLFSKPKTLTCSLGVSGEFPDYNPGEAYTGTVNITGATGATTVDLVSEELPAGYTIDTITSPDRVRVQWPGIPPSIDPNTRALLHMDGANGSTTFTDVVGANWTMNGSATVSTTQSKFGGASAGFNGSSYLISGDRAAMSLTGTDWTIEAFVYCNTHLGNIASSRQAPNGLTFRVQGGKLEAFYGEGQGFIIADTSHPTLTWFHAAITKQGNTVRLYQNGVIVGTNTWSVDINNTATPYMAIGAYYPFVGGIQEPFNGYIDEFRVSSVARYGSSNFTPPTAPFSGSEGGGVSTLGNLNFESGDTSWIKGYGWTITNTGLADGGTWSAKYNGVGQSNLAHVTAAPVNPGTSITASCRVSKGANREDYAGGAVVLQWFDANLNPLGFNVGNVVNTGTSAFQTSSVTATAPTGAAFVRLAGSGTRDVKGRASDLVYLDSFSWNHTFALGGSGTGATPITGPIPLTFRVRDANGCTAVATRTIAAQTGQWIFFGFNTPLSQAYSIIASPASVDFATRQVLPVASTPFTAAFGGGTLLVPLSNGTNVLRSTDRGANFSTTTSASAFGTDISPPARSGTRWVLGRSNTTVQNSTTDGATWANSTGQAGRYIAAGSGSTLVAFAAASTQARVSTDNGASFSLAGSITGLGTSNLSIAFNNGTFIVVSRASNISSYSISSDNGATWAALATLPFATQSTAILVLGEAIVAGSTGVFVAAAQNGEVVYTTNSGTTWQAGGSTGLDTITSMAFGNGTFVITGSLAADPRVAVSTNNGQTWTAYSTLNGSGSFTLNAVVFMPA